MKRGALFAAAGVLAALNVRADRLVGAFQQHLPLEVIARLGGISAVIWFAMYAAMKIGFEKDPQAVRSGDGAVLAAVVLLSFIPLSFAARAGLLICGLYLFATTAPGMASRRVSVILLALTGPLVWGPILLRLFAAPILAFDAHLVGAVVGSGVEGNVVGFSDGTSKFLIGGPCSSVHNISLAIVLWATAGAMFDLRIDRRYLLVGAAMMLWMFVLNILRLATIGFFPRNFDFLHSGTGATLFSWTALIGACLIAGMGVIRAAERQR